jgi:PAS domain S-box-containing protein
MPSVLTTFGPRLIAGSALLVVLLVVNIIIRDRSTRALYRNTEAVAQAHEVINALDRVSASVVDAETGERGYLITGQPNYLEPYNSALAVLDGEMAHLAGLVADNPAQSGAVAALRDAIDLKLSQLRETIDVHQTQGPQAAVALVLTGRGKATMDAIRLHIRGMQAREQQALATRAAEAESAYQRATVTGWATGLLGVVITVAFVWSARRNARQLAAAAATLYGEREQLHVTLASIGDGVVVTDPVGTVTMLNGVAEQLTGWSQQEARGLPLTQVFNIVNEETRNGVENPVMRALGDGVIVGLANHTVLISKDGAERPIADSAAPIRGAGGVVLGAVLVFRDVTDDRKAETALNRSLAREQSWAARMRQVAAASLTINAATTQDSIVGVIDSESRRILGAGRCKVMFEEAAAVEEEGSLVVPLTNRAGKPLGYIQCSDKTSGRFDDDDRAVLMQMAQMASIALENSTLYNEIRAADARKDEFLATLAHELRNPLAPISNSLQVLRAESDPLRLAESRKVIERQVGQLVHLVDDLLDVSRVSRGKLELRRSRVRLAEVLHAAIETSQPVIAAHRHTLRVNEAAGDVWLDADLTRLAQVFSNLLNNGAKYMEPGGVIAVEASADADNVVVAVRDRGIGIAPDVLPYVFDMFVQADRSLERAQGGLGIGLTLVRRLVELHDGSVTVLSDGPGKGSEFVVRLPRAAAGVADTSALGATPPAPADALPARRILVVDDNKDAVDSLVLLLSIVGQSVVAARDGLDALEQFERFEPEVVVLDLGLPGINGYEVARRIRSADKGRHVTLVALTGWGQDEDRRRSITAGFDYHLVKPVDFEALKTLLAGLPRIN